MGVLSRYPASPKLPMRPPFGGRNSKSKTRSHLARGWNVKLIKRLAVAMGSLLALAFAGGAHVRW